MPYVRISLMMPMRGKKAQVDDLNSQLVAFYREQPGCLQSHAVRAADGSGEVGRVSFWESESTADQAANADRSLSLRASLHLLQQRGHQDRSFLTE